MKTEASAQGFRLNVVLFEPEIPQNTGNIARSCAAVGARLHLIEPLGFSVSDRRLKRAGLDYWHLVDIMYYEGFPAFLSRARQGNLVFITKTASRTYDTVDFSGDVYLIFGKETTGLPPDILRAHHDRCVRIPMRAEARSLNLSNAVAIVLYEACRQNDFGRLKLNGSREFN
jgi:tRNA (cytidine/uridine-2'-O-)-methyltransferase